MKTEQKKSDERKVILYIAMSLDGYIAKPGDDLSFLSVVQQEGEDYGYADFVSTVDTVILGRRTYDWVMQQVSEFPHAGKETYVVSRTHRPPQDNITFYTADLRVLLSSLKSKAGKHIFVDGGAELVHALLQYKLIDEMYISVIPVLLGQGIALFKEGRPEEKLQLISATSFEKGLAQLRYQVIH